jgi:hypothetical protein
MKTLIIYDNSGRIWLNMSGDYALPDGINYLEVEIPEGKMVVSVDISVTPNVPIFVDLPVPAVKTLEERIVLVENVLNELLLS